MTNLKEQADGLRAFYADENISAVGWNQTSVNGDDWSNFGGYEEDEDGEETPRKPQSATTSCGRSAAMSTPIFSRFPRPAAFTSARRCCTRGSKAEKTRRS